MILCLPVLSLLIVTVGQRGTSVAQEDRIFVKGRPVVGNYKYGAKCVREKPNPQTGECSVKWYWKYNNCNAGDRCEDPSVGNTAGACGGTVDAGSNTSGHILAGQCAADVCPSVGCRNGGWYKTCCKYNDYGPVAPVLGIP